MSESTCWEKRGQGEKGLTPPAKWIMFRPLIPQPPGVRPLFPCPLFSLSPSFHSDASRHLDHSELAHADITEETCAAAVADILELDQQTVRIGEVQFRCAAGRAAPVFHS